MITVPYYETSNFCFSNFSAHTVMFGGVKYQTAEHAYHAQKFDDEQLRKRIEACDSPLDAWELSRELKTWVREDWNDIRLEVLADIIRAKVKHHPEVRNALVATGSEEIVEVNPKDSYWGNGPDGKGQNHTGKILMKIRAELKDGDSIRLDSN